MMITDPKNQIPDEKNRMFRDLIETLSHVIFTLDDRGRFTYLSPQCEEILGLPPEALIGRPITSVVIPDDKDRLCSKYREVRGGSTYPTDYKVLDTTGGVHVVRAVSRSYTGPDGKIKVVGIISEISNWLTAEEALRSSEEKVRQIIGYSKDGIVLVDEKGLLVEWSPAMEVITGIPRSNALGQPAWEIQYQMIPHEKRDPGFQERIRTTYAAIMNRSVSQWTSQTSDYQIQRPDMSRRTIETTEFLIPAETGSMVAAIVRDITDRKTSELCLKAANRKLKLLSGITRHDINNQLTALQGYLNILATRSLNPPEREYILQALAAAERTAAMIQFTREYEEIGVEAPVWHDCHQLIETVAGQFREERVCITNDIPAGTEVYADPLVIKVFYNLIDNALRYGETITTIRFFTEDHHGSTVITCEDDGQGIKTGEKEQIFRQGYGKNTGLGLAISREILDITGITISENGTPGRGARFEMLIPKDAIRHRIPVC